MNSVSNSKFKSCGLVQRFVWVWCRPGGDCRRCLRENCSDGGNRGFFHKSTHSSGAVRPRTPPWSIRFIYLVLPPLKFDGADRPGRWGGLTSKWGGWTLDESTMGRIDLVGGVAQWLGRRSVAGRLSLIYA